MAFKEVTSLDADNTIALGGSNRKTGKANPQSAEGYYLGTRKIESKKAKTGFAAIHFLQTPEGNLGIWGKTDLDRKLSGVSPGTMVRLSFDKMVPTPNGEMYKYKVEVDDSNTIVVNISSDTNEAVYGGGPADDYQGNGSGFKDEDAEEVEEYDAEESAQSAALAAAERKARVEALVKGKNRTARN